MGAIIGSGTNMRADITIGSNVIVGYTSNVIKDLLEEGIYFGNPAKKVAELKQEMRVEPPDNWKPYMFPKELLERYLPYYKE